MLLSKGGTRKKEKKKLGGDEQILKFIYQRPYGICKEMLNLWKTIVMVAENA